MSASTAPGSALRHLPGWADATCEPLHGGLSNRTWLLEKNGRRAVLKVDAELREPPLNTRRQEAIIQSAAARAGLATDVLYVADGLYLTDYVAGDVWSPASFADHGNLELLAQVLCRVHALPLSRRDFKPRLAAKQYARAIRSDDALVARCLGIVEKVCEPRRPCLCHNDLVAENILSTPALKLLDWEYACDNDPLFDLATVVEHHELDESSVTVLLDAYFDGDGERYREALRDQQRLYLALLWLWLAARTETMEQELADAARRLTTSCF